MSCPICLDKINCSVIGSCTHHFCIKCLIDWCVKGGEHCPICKTRIETIRRDIEFDHLNGINEIELEKLVTIIKINFPKDSEAGITLENNYSLYNMGKRLPGVKITRINKNKQCFKSGLRYGDILLFINNVPCVNHEQVINIINNAIKSNLHINIILDRKKQ